ncbi:MAG: hypothetical protein CFH06_01920, partial [Alphaproteobacteria bacterium MarineAlpha3_Bin5]
PWQNDLYEPLLKVVDGKVEVPAEPGWGVHIKRDWLERAQYQKSELD